MTQVKTAAELQKIQMEQVIEDLDGADKAQIIDKPQKTKDANGVADPDTDSRQVIKDADRKDKAQIADKL